MRARNNDSWIDHETVALQPGLAGQVGGGHVFRYTALEQFQEALPLFGQHARVQEWLQRIERQMQGMQQQISGLVPGIVAAVSEGQARYIELADGITH